MSCRRRSSRRRCPSGRCSSGRRCRRRVQRRLILLVRLRKDRHLAVFLFNIATLCRHLSASLLALVIPRTSTNVPCTTPVSGLWMRWRAKYGGSFRYEKKFDADYCKINLHGDDVWLVKPQSYMNLSGGRFAAYSTITACRCRVAGGAR